MSLFYLKIGGSLFACVLSSDEGESFSVGVLLCLFTFSNRCKQRKNASNQNKNVNTKSAAVLCTRVLLIKKFYNKLNNNNNRNRFVLGLFCVLRLSLSLSRLFWGLTEGGGNVCVCVCFCCVFKCRIQKWEKVRDVGVGVGRKIRKVLIFAIIGSGCVAA